jgi:hypothetical protein
MNAPPLNATKRAKLAAPVPYLGFRLHTVRPCYHLVTAPVDATVSVEYGDDVPVRYADCSTE